MIEPVAKRIEDEFEYEDEDESKDELFPHSIALIWNYGKLAQFLFRFDWVLAARGGAEH
jgi:hypothetical protein